MNDIDPQQFGRLTAQVERLEADVTELRSDVKSMIAMLEQAKGGWRTLMLVGGLGGAVGAALGKAMGWWASMGPKA